MSFDEKLAERVRERIAETHKNIEEKKMFGGLCFMVNNKMCVGIERERLMLRVDPENYEALLEKEGCTPMDFTGRPMKGYIYVDVDVLKTKKQMDYWVGLALEYNKKAKPSKKEKNNYQKIVSR
jgi:TfoX/Sxy family transcriptional regulator of competence genes